MWSRTTVLYNRYNKRYNRECGTFSVVSSATIVVTWNSLWLAINIHLSTLSPGRCNTSNSTSLPWVNYSLINAFSLFGFVCMCCDTTETLVVSSFSPLCIVFLSSCLLQLSNWRETIRLRRQAFFPGESESVGDWSCSPACDEPSCVFTLTRVWYVGHGKTEKGLQASSANTQTCPLLCSVFLSFLFAFCYQSPVIQTLFGVHSAFIHSFTSVMALWPLI